MLGILVALSWELKTLSRQSIHMGSWARIREDVLVALSGIGAERAHAAGELLLSQGATGLLSWGFAAALDDGLMPGSVIIPERVIRATGESYPISADWHGRLYSSLSARFSVAGGALLESESIINRRDAKRKLARQTHAIATDMESCAQARLAQARRVPFAVVRAISDRSSTDIPESVMQALSPNGAVNVRSCLARACLRPVEFVAIMQLALQFNAARNSLKQAGAPALEASRVYLDAKSASSASTARL